MSSTMTKTAIDHRGREIIIIMKSGRNDESTNVHRCGNPGHDGHAIEGSAPSLWRNRIWNEEGAIANQIG